MKPRSQENGYRSRPPKRNFQTFTSRNREYVPRPRARQIFCDFCLKPGHKWRQCRERGELMEQRKERFSDSGKSTGPDHEKQFSGDNKNSKQDFQ